MQPVRMDKADVLEILKKNRESHRTIFLEAQDGYRKFMIDAFEARLKAVRDGKPFSRYIEATEPEDHTKDYDRVISMLEMTLADEVELSETDFQSYIQDEWRWKDQFLTSNSMYSTTAQTAVSNRGLS